MLRSDPLSQTNLLTKSLFHAKWTITWQIEMIVLWLRKLIRSENNVEMVRCDLQLRKLRFGNIFIILRWNIEAISCFGFFKHPTNIQQWHHSLQGDKWQVLQQMGSKPMGKAWNYFACFCVCVAFRMQKHSLVFKPMLASSSLHKLLIFS